MVTDYLSGKGSPNYLCQVYGVKSHKDLWKWINAYKNLGIDGLRRSRKIANYTFEFKLHVVQLYLTTEISCQELANSLGLNNPPLISKWVNDFRKAGPDALRPKPKGRKPILKQRENKPKVTVQTSNVESEYVKQLENELLMLRIENAFLKEMRRLRLEDEARQRERLESSTASEENSD